MGLKAQNNLTQRDALQASWNRTKYAYDDNGNLQIDAESNSYAYDYRNRLIEVQNNESATIAEYTFDALGRRIKKVVGDTTTYFFYDTNNRV